jgi:uncharacterized membrane protein YhhN
LKNRFYLFLFIPVVFGLLALQTDFIVYKLAVPFTCSLIILWNFRKNIGENRAVWFVVAALAFSMLGDYFLSNKRGNEMFFVYGIAAYWGAHLGYSLYAFKNGGLHKRALLLLGLVFVPYYVVFLYPAIADPVLSGSVFFYLGISVVALALAFGMTKPFPQKIFYIIGIALIVVSDTFISFNEFLQFRTFNELILPTYYLAHLSITISLLIRKSSPS